MKESERRAKQPGVRKNAARVLGPGVSQRHFPRLAAVRPSKPVQTTENEFAESSEREVVRLPVKVKIKTLAKIQLLQLDSTRRGVENLAGNGYCSTRFFGNHYCIVFRPISQRRLVSTARVRHGSGARRGL